MHLGVSPRPSRSHIYMRTEPHSDPRRAVQRSLCVGSTPRRSNGMRSSRRGICWLAVITIIATLTAVSLRAALPDGPWAHEDALGDVAVSFENAVRIYDNASGLQKGDDLTVAGTNGGLAFDNALNLLVTNTSNDRL